LGVADDFAAIVEGCFVAIAGVSGGLFVIESIDSFIADMLLGDGGAEDCAMVGAAGFLTPEFAILAADAFVDAIRELGPRLELLVTGVPTAVLGRDTVAQFAGKGPLKLLRILGKVVWFGPALVSEMGPTKPAFGMELSLARGL